MNYYYDIIIIDEAQDMYSILYNFVLKIINDSIKPVYNMIIIGDRKQNIFYGLKSSDERYLLLA